MYIPIKIYISEVGKTINFILKEFIYFKSENAMRVNFVMAKNKVKANIIISMEISMMDSGIMIKRIT